MSILRPVTLFLILLLGALTASGQNQKKPDCADFQELDLALKNAYDLGDRASSIELVESIYALSQECPEFPENDQFWKVLYFQSHGDTLYIPLNAQSLKFNQQKNDSAALHRNITYEASTLFVKGQYLKASKLFRVLRSWYRQNNYYHLHARTTLNLANSLNQLGQFGTSVEALLDGLNFLEKAPDDVISKSELKAMLHLMISFGLLSQSKYPEAIVYNNLAIEGFRDRESRDYLITSLNQKGSIFLEMEQLDSASIYMEEALAMTDTTDYEGKRNYALNSYSLSALWSDKGEYKKALPYAQRSAEIDRRIGDEEAFRQSEAMTGIIYSYIDPNRAKQILKESYGYYTQTRRFEMLSSVEAKLAEVLVRTGEAHKATDYWKSALAHKDSLYKETMAIALENARVKYQTKQKEEENAMQADALVHAQELADTQSQLIWTIGIGLGIASMFAALAFLAFLQKRKTNQKLEAQKQEIAKQNEQKEVLLKEIHHRVKNNLQIVSNLLELQSKGIEDEQVHALAQEGQNRVKSMALIHQKLYQEEGLRIDFEDYIKTLVPAIQNMYGRESDVSTEVSAHGLKFDIDTGIPLGLIINELVTNAFKYGFAGIAQKRLKIAIEKADDDYFRLTVQDNGGGLPADLDISKVKSLGLRLVSRLSRQLHGQLSFSKENGSTFSVMFKDTKTRLLTD